MAGAVANLPALAERNDVHKSCKALEVLVNVLADYTEAAGAVVQLQKKLAKALREAAGLKTTSEIASNALNASASVFEVLVDLDAKFAKLADKESNSVSGEVKKWFKKLAKEEKAHDERLNNVNFKIKQAGINYERKVKKNARDAAEEHTRYLSLLGTVGPELTQEKYNHAVFVTQRHTSTTYSVAAAVARIADAEWLRTCEGVRRFAPNIGHLAEWRVLCEGGWTGPRPKGLPDTEPQPDTAPQPLSLSQEQRPFPQRLESSRSVDEESRHGSDLQQGPEHDMVAYSPTQLPETPAPRPENERRSFDSHLSRPPSVTGHEISVDPSQPSERKVRSSNSLASLASFPSPPTHFPIPAVMTPTGHKPSPSFSGAPPASPITPMGPRKTPSPAPTHRATSSTTFSTLPRVAESPAREALQTSIPPSNHTDSVASPRPMAPIRKEPPLMEDRPRTTEPTRTTPSPSKELANFERTHRATGSTSSSRPLPIPRPSEPITPALTGHSSSTSTLPRGDYLPDDPGTPTRPNFTQRNTEPMKGVQRSESQQSRGSVVASIRGKLTHSTAPASPPPNDIPKLPFSVSEIASRYANTEPAPGSPARQAISPPPEPLSPRSESTGRQWGFPPPVPGDARPPPSGSASSRGSMATAFSLPDDINRRRAELDELERREREFLLRQREREVDLRARELELERAKLLAESRGGGNFEAANDGYASDRAREYGRSPPSTPGIQGRFSYSTTHLVPPAGSGSITGARVSSSSSQQSQQSRSQPPSPIPGSSPPNDHAPFCGCSQCSIEKYRAPPSPQAPVRPEQPPLQLRPEKPKNWMRRLSMPGVGAGFSLEGSTKKIAAALGSPGSSTSSVVREALANNRHSMSFVQEDGKFRRSYDPQAPGHRSAADLTGGGVR